jgi:hypothetical protein
LILEDWQMNNWNRGRPPQEAEQLATAIREMASSVRAQFVQDDEKMRNYIVACEEREKNRMAE